MKKVTTELLKVWYFEKKIVKSIESNIKMKKKNKWKMKHRKWKVKIKKGKSEKCSVKLKVKSAK